MMFLILLATGSLTTSTSEVVKRPNRFLHGLSAPLRWGGSVVDVGKNVIGGTVGVVQNVVGGTIGATKYVVAGTANTVKNVVTAPVRAVQGIQVVVHNVDIMTKQTNELIPMLKQTIDRSDYMVQKTGASILKAVPKLRLSIGIAAGSIVALSAGSLYMRARRSKLELLSNKRPSLNGESKKELH